MFSRLISLAHSRSFSAALLNSTNQSFVRPLSIVPQLRRHDRLLLPVGPHDLFAALAKRTPPSMAGPGTGAVLGMTGTNGAAQLGPNSGTCDSAETQHSRFLLDAQLAYVAERHRRAGRVLLASFLNLPRRTSIVAENEQAEPPLRNLVAAGWSSVTHYRHRVVPAPVLNRRRFFPIRPHVDLVAAGAALGADHTTFEIGNLDIGRIAPDVDKRLMPTGIVETECD